MLDRHMSDTDTSATEREVQCGGLGKFEYSGKALPHALLHMTELLMRGGHHAAYCTFLQEVAHKYNIKVAAKLARTYGSRNTSQDRMLEFMLTQEIYTAAIKCSEGANASSDDSSTSTNDAEQERTAGIASARATTEGTTTPVAAVTMCLKDRVCYLDNWSHIRAPPSSAWESTMISNKVRLTRGELLYLLCRKLNIGRDRADRARVCLQLTWEGYGSLIEQHDTFKRKMVGICRESPNRRDFVHIKPPVGSQTCLSAEIIMFLRISGFATAVREGVVLPEGYRSPIQNKEFVVFALVRWLSPHPDALLRDDQLRPICPAPLDINHALWKYAEEPRAMLTTTVMNRNMRLYPGNSMEERVRNAKDEQRAMFDLVLPETLDTFMNCTICNTTTDCNVILETITIPF